jgi:AmpD protein
MADGRTNVNAFSIGIEMVGTKTSGYTTAQYTALNTLITDIKTRHTIKYIVGHDDIASGRKTDPWKFDWSRIKR